MLEIDNVKAVTDQEQDKPVQNNSESVLIFDKEELFTRVRSRLLRIARLRGVAADARDDVVQETLLVAWKRLDRLHSPDQFQLWVDEICRTICRRYLHASHREAERRIPLIEASFFDEPDAFEDALVASGTGPGENDPIEMLSRQGLTTLLERALGSLSDQARHAVELYYLLDVPQREAALRLGVSISALETQLHRARRQLRQVLNGSLRAEAESFGLPLDEEPSMGWHETRQWCYFCGHQRLHGIFEVEPDSHFYLRMRCPECSRHYGSDVVNGKGIVPVDGLRSFQPAFKRTMRGVSHHLLQAVRAGQSPCVYCGKSIPVQVSGPKQKDAQPPNQRRYWVGGQCPYCGEYGFSWWSADDAVYWSDQTVQQFILQHPRWLNEPDLPLEYDGQLAILFRLSDRMSTTRLDVIAHRQTLQILATFRN